MLTFTWICFYASSLNLQLARRLVEQSKKENSRSSTSIRSGAVLRARYRLSSLLYTDSRRKGHPTYSRHDPIHSGSDSDSDSPDDEYEAGGPEPGKSFPAYAYFPGAVGPDAKINDYVPHRLENVSRGSKGERPHPPKHWGRGSFGDVWMAYDMERKADVALKIFYVEETWEYLTPDLADELSRTEYLVQAKYECQAVLDIVEEARSKNLSGVDHICQCFAEHISDAGPDDPVFLAMELCGEDLEYILDNGSPITDDPPTWARYIIKSLLEGINLLTSLDPPKIHHDLKVGNVAITLTGEAKIIDWGAVMEFKADSVGGACTPQYTPPEVYCRYGKSFRYPPKGRAYEYDTYSVGLIYHELVCPRDEPPTWVEDHSTDWGYGLKNLPRKDFKCREKSAQSQQDRRLIAGLMATNPDYRLSPELAIDKISKLLPSRTRSKLSLRQKRKRPMVFQPIKAFVRKVHERFCQKRSVHSCAGLKGCVVKHGGCHKG